MTKKLKIIRITWLSLVLFFVYFISSTQALAKDWKVIDVNSPDISWTEESTPGTYKKTVTLYVGDTFQKIYDSGIEEGVTKPTEIMKDFGRVITEKGNGSFQVMAPGNASIIYLSDGQEGWTKKTIYIVAKEKEVKSLSTSTNTISMTTKETKQIQVTINATMGYETLKVATSNSKIVKVEELVANRLRNDSNETIYTYKLTPVATGTAKITVSSNFDPSFTKTIQVTVRKTGARKPTYYVSSSTAKYSYTSMAGDLLSITKSHQVDKPVKLIKIGTSLDKRNIYCLRIGNPNAKKRVFVMAGLHAREYMNPYFVMDNVEDMLNHYDTSYSKRGYTYRQLYENVCLYVLPMVNPDGITIAQQGADGIKDKTLRANVKNIKKRSGVSYSRWKGNARNVNLNRNFPVGWKKLSSYRKEGTAGSKPGSEPETKCLMNYIETIKPTAVISYHSMGEILYWGYAVNKSSSGYIQARGMKNIIAKLTGYYPMPAHKTKRSALGCLEDWLAYEKKIPNVCIETGSVATPLPMSQYKRLYDKNKLVIEEICKYFR